VSLLIALVARRLSFEVTSRLWRSLLPNYYLNCSAFLYLSVTILKIKKINFYDESMKKSDKTGKLDLKV